MATSRYPLLDRMQPYFSGLAEMEQKRMFGSDAFMLRGHLCIAARPERLMCRIGLDAAAELANQPGCTAVIMQGREMRGWVYVDAEVVQGESELKQWVDRVLAFNATLPAKDG